MTFNSETMQGCSIRDQMRISQALKAGKLLRVDAAYRVWQDLGTDNAKVIAAYMPVLAQTLNQRINERGALRGHHIHLNNPKKARFIETECPGDGTTVFHLCVNNWTRKDPDGYDIIKTTVSRFEAQSWLRR